jgi:acyl transferase domain-containing protein
MQEPNESMISAEQRARVIELWKQSLGLLEVDLDRGFADLGGTSLVANQFVARLAQHLSIDLPVIRIFEFPTLRLLLRYLADGRSADAHAQDTGVQRESASNVQDAVPYRTNHDVAIIGMACRFPGAKNLEEFWANLLDGKDTITILRDEDLHPDVPDELRSDPRYVRAAGLIDEPYAMDAEFFDINPMEAKLTDPQQRILLETAWHALEHAGEGVGRMTERVAVFAGTEDNSYYRAEVMPFPEAEKRVGRFAVMTGNEKDYVAMRIAHKLNLKGPAISVHTACSTSLVAVIMACKSLRQAECDIALAGGASVHFPTPEGYYFQEGGVFSPDGHCRPFDEAAQGTNFTDGSGVVVLKRLEDAIRDRNTVFAVIKGGAINSDGGDKVSFSAPSVAGQSSCIRDALADAGVDAGTIQYLEAHGTATPVGDPIEVEALRQAFASRADRARLQYCGLGSVKSNIGHTTAAAGVASLIKMALALRHGVIPATVHFNKPNPHLDLENSPFFIVDSKLDWPKGEPARRAGISSFGIGGTNSHLVVEEAPALAAAVAQQERPFEIWPVSAKAPGPRDRLLEALSQERYWPRDVAYTLQNGRALFAHRGARVRLSHLPVEDILVQPAMPALEDPSLVFMFPGQGSQYIEMGRSLAAHLPEFKQTFSRCCSILSAEMGIDFEAFIFNPENRETLENTRYTQPALFAIEVSLGRMLLGWGIEPAYMLGHSVGEFAAAHLAGVFELEDALRLIAARGRLMAGLPRGRMLSARGALDAVLAAAGEAVDIASVNGPVHCVLAGPDDQMERVQLRLEAAGIPCRPLHTSHAFHSAMMTPVVEPFLEVVRSVRLQAPQRAIISTVTGERMTDAQATDPLYWANHLRATVRFSPALFRNIEMGGNVFLEVGPRSTLSSLAVQHFAKLDKARGQCVAIATLGDEANLQTELGGVGTALAKLWCAGVVIPWEKIWVGGTKVPLTSAYPFDRKVYRFSEGRKTERPMARETGPTAIPTGNAAIPAAQSAPSLSASERLGQELGALFSDYSGLAVERLDTTFVECGFDSLVLMQIGVELGKRYGVSVALRDLMERHNTLSLLSTHIAATATPEKLHHLRAPAPIPQAAASPLPLAAPLALPELAQTPHSLASALPSDAVEALRERLLAIRDLIDAQLRPLEGLRHLSELPVTAPAAAAPVAQPSKPIETEAAKGEPLLRARHAEPPQAGAFRSQAASGEDAWYVFDADHRRYDRIEH